MHTRFSFLWSYTIHSTAVAWSASVLLSPEKAWGHRWAQIKSWSAIDGKTDCEAEASKTSELSPQERESPRHVNHHGVTSGHQINNWQITEINHWEAQAPAVRTYLSKLKSSPGQHAWTVFQPAFSPVERSSLEGQSAGLESVETLSIKTRTRNSKIKFQKLTCQRCRYLTFSLPKLNIEA